MPEISVARRYADAVIAVAAEREAIEVVGSNLRAFADLLDDHGGLLRATLCTPVFSKDERSAVLAEILPKLGLHPLTADFLNVVNGKGRMAAIGDIATAYADMADARSGRLSVRVTTAHPMTAEIADEVRRALSASTGKEVVLKPDVDSDLIGGMVVRMGGKVYDSSIRTRLDQVKRTLLSNQVPASAK